jgi:RNA polymerase sigma-70 factor (ECF subfamily)
MIMTDSGASSYRLDLNDPGTFEDLVRTYAEPLIRYAYSIIGSSQAAEDAMEDAFAALLAGRYHFDSQQQLRAWLYKATHHKAVDYLRRHKREVPLEDVENVLSSPDPASTVALKERSRTIYICLQRLPQQYREVLVLTYFENFSVSEICAILRKTKKQVYNLLARAKVALKELLLEEGISNEEL